MSSGEQLEKANAEIEANKHDAEARKEAFLPAQSGLRNLHRLMKSGREKS